MPQDGGWIELVEPATQRVCARAHLLVSEMAPRGWRGELQYVHPKPSAGSLAAGAYLARFGRSLETHRVQLALSDRGAQEVLFDPDDEPAVLRERSDGE